MGVRADAMQSRIGEAAYDLSGEAGTIGTLADRQKNPSSYPRYKPIHILFEEQVVLAPDSVAVEFEDRLLSYEEVNERANRIAR